MIKTIIFDVGGVLKKMDFKKIYSNFSLKIGIPPEIVINYHKEKLDDILLGNISLEQFWQDMRSAGGKTDVSYEDIWTEETNKNTEINNDLLLIIQKLRRKYTVGVLSNVSHSRLFTDNKTDLYSHFDYAIFSCEEHLQKPDPAFYKIALKRAKVEPSEAIFIDDKKEFIEEAEKVGIKSIFYIYGDNEKLLDNLKDLNVEQYLLEKQKNMIDQKIFDKERNFHGVKGLVFIGNKILTYRRDTKTKSFPLHIDLPGGGKEEVESPFDTFKRETKEEFGIEINSNDVKYAKQYMSAMDATKESYFIVVNPLNAKEDDIVFGDEGLEPMLITPSEYLKLNDAIKRQQDKVIDYLAVFKK